MASELLPATTKKNEEAAASRGTGIVHFGFFMNWLGKQQGEGVEYDLLLWAIALALIVQGAGAFSLDRVISAKLKN